MVRARTQGKSEASAHMTHAPRLTLRVFWSCRPAFDKIVQGSVVTKTDNSLGMSRVEIM